MTEQNEEHVMKMGGAFQTIGENMMKGVIGQIWNTLDLNGDGVPDKELLLPVVMEVADAGGELSSSVDIVKVDAECQKIGGAVAKVIEDFNSPQTLWAHVSDFTTCAQAIGGAVGEFGNAIDQAKVKDGITKLQTGGTALFGYLNGVREHFVGQAKAKAMKPE